MKRRSNIAATLIITGLLLVGSGCTWGELEQVIDFMSEWSHEKGYTDENGNPTAKAAKDYMFGSGDTLADAALGAGAATKGLKDTDEAFSNARRAVAQGKYDDADEIYKSLEKQRPNDWEVLNRRAAANIDMGRFNAADDKVQQADERACKTDRCKVAMYENRIEVLSPGIDELRKSGESDRAKACKKLKMSRNARSQLVQQYELMSINSYKNTNLAEQQRLKTKYDNLANHQANLVNAANADLNTYCGGAI